MVGQGFSTPMLGRSQATCNDKSTYMASDRHCDYLKLEDLLTVWSRACGLDWTLLGFLLDRNILIFLQTLANFFCMFFSPHFAGHTWRMNFLFWGHTLVSIWIIATSSLDCRRRSCNTVVFATLRAQTFLPPVEGLQKLCGRFVSRSMERTHMRQRQYASNRLVRVFLFLPGGETSMFFVRSARQW